MPAATNRPPIRGLWFLTLFTAEEVPAAMVTYVALLMLLQMGAAPAVATLLSALLFLPWVLKSFVRPRVERVGHFRVQLHIAEGLLTVVMILLALSFRHGLIVVFVCLMATSLLCAWHELTARMYYERMLTPVFQRLFTSPKMATSQIAVILTYGVLIFMVGTLQVYFRQIRYSWSLGCYVAAGIFLLFTFHHLLWLRNVTEQPHHKFIEPARPRSLAGVWEDFLLLLLLLLPQGLMFHARVLYLFAEAEDGGLECTMPEIGFAQGTVGVIAFSIGIAIGRRFIAHHRWPQVFWPMAVCLVLSPFVYLGMTVFPPQSLIALSACTMAAQLLFGLGIGICRHPIHNISGARYRNTINMLQIPLISAALLVPMAMSGLLVEWLGYSRFFLLNALSGPVCLLVIWLLRKRK